MLYDDRESMIKDVLKYHKKPITRQQAEQCVDSFLAKIKNEEDKISKLVWESFTGFPDDFNPFGND